MDCKSWICDFIVILEPRQLLRKHKYPTLILYKVITAKVSCLIPIRMKNENMIDICK